MTSPGHVCGAATLVAVLTACAGRPPADVGAPAPVVSAPAASAGALLDPERGVLTMAPLLQRVTPGVVNIAVRSRVPVQTNPLFDDPFFRRFFDLPEPPPQRRDVLSAGSGVIVDAAGYIITNAHVIGLSKHVQVLVAGQTGDPPHPKCRVPATADRRWFPPL